MTGLALARIMVTGSRTWTDRQRLADTLDDTWHDATQLGYDSLLLTQGAASGADMLADTWALENAAPRDPHPADWDGPCAPDCPAGHRRQARGRDYCPRAGHRRNQEMIDLRPLLVVAFHCDGSRGTADAIRRAQAADIPVRTITA